VRIVVALSMLLGQRSSGCDDFGSRKRITLTCCVIPVLATAISACVDNPPDLGKAPAFCRLVAEEHEDFEAEAGGDHDTDASCPMPGVPRAIRLALEPGST
jgi:hypothetical protein